MMMKLKHILSTILNGGFGHVFTGNLMVNIFAIGIQFFVANIVGPEDLGLIKTIQSYFGILIIFVTFGFTTVLMKEIPLISSRKEQDKLFNYSIRIVTRMFLVVYIMMFIGSVLNVFSFENNIRLFNMIYLLGLFPLSYNSLRGVFLQARKKFKDNSKILIRSKFVSIILIFVLTWFYKTIGFVIGSVLGYCITSYWYYQFSDKTQKVNEPIFNKEKIWRTAVISMFTFLTGKGAVFLDMILLTYFSSNDLLIGYFGFAITLISGLNILSQSVQEYLTPNISSKALNVKLFKNYLISKQLIFIAVIIVVSLLAYLLLPSVLTLLFPKYQESGTFFNLLLISWVFRSSYALNNTGLVALGRIDLCLKQNIITTVVSICFLILLITKFGVLGAAYARIIATVVGLILSILFLKYVYKINYASEDFK